MSDINYLLLGVLCLASAAWWIGVWFLRSFQQDAIAENTRQLTEVKLRVDYWKSEAQRFGSCAGCSQAMRTPGAKFCPCCGKPHP